MTIQSEAERELDVRESAHDLNNLLTAIICAADSALRQDAVDPETRADLAHIREGARRGVALVSGHSARVDDATAVAVSINETIRGTSRLLAHRLGSAIDLVLELGEDNDRARIDPSLLDRILLNLVVNAARAMPRGGTVTLRTERRVLTEAKSRVPDTIPPGDYIAITVADTGPGIAAEHLPHIFERGFSVWRDAEGAGLGLSSVRDCVRRSHGFLAAESAEGQGTRFEVLLHYHDEAVTEPPVAASGRPAVAGLILLVEDDDLVSEIAERILRREGWTVLRAETAEAALDLLQESECDLMIADVALPGMDGLALTEQVHARWPRLPVVLTSGYTALVGEAGSKAPHVAFLTKPYGRAELLAVVSRVVEPGDTAEPA